MFWFLMGLLVLWIIAKLVGWIDSPVIYELAPEVILALLLYTVYEKLGVVDKLAKDLSDINHRINSLEKNLEGESAKTSLLASFIKEIIKGKLVG